MISENALTVAAANLAGLAFRLRGRPPFHSPRRVLILKPCCISQVLLATPLLAALHEAYPEACFDWAVSNWARPAIASNPRLSGIVDTGRIDMPGGTWSEVKTFIERLRAGKYDTCFVPARSSLLSYIPWRAGIPQRIGLNVSGRGFAYTMPVSAPKHQVHEAELYLSLGKALGIDQQPAAEFYPTDSARTAITRRLEEQVGWHGDRPLVVVHPGGVENPARPRLGERWPVERFALLASRLMRDWDAQVVLVGSEADRPLDDAVFGLMPAEIPNLGGSLKLRELGALCEVADLYVGNDSGPTHVAAAVGCPTLAIFGSSDPAVSAPYGPSVRVEIVRVEKANRSFSWDDGATVDEAAEAAGRLLGSSAREPADGEEV